MDTDKEFDRLMKENAIPKSCKILKAEILNFIVFVDEIIKENKENFQIDNFNSNDLILAKEYFNNIDPVTLMSNFVKHVLPYSQKIKNKDEGFFLKNVGKLLNGLPPDKISFIYKIVESEHLLPEDREVIWDFWNVFIALAEKNKKTK